MAGQRFFFTFPTSIKIENDHGYVIKNLLDFEINLFSKSLVGQYQKPSFYHFSDTKSKKHIRLYSYAE